MKHDSSCPSARTIIEAWGGGDASLRRFIERHVASCAHCDAIVRALDELGGFAADGGDIYSEIARVIDARLSSERPHRWESLVRANAEFHHRVVVAHLISRSDECYPSNPRDGLSYADAAIAAFEAMNKGRLPEIAADALLYATALKNRATHLYLLGRYSHALCAADASADTVRLFGDTEGVVAHRAAIALARGMIFGDVDVCEYDKALVEIDTAEALFLTASPERVADARWWRAMILARCGRLKEARGLFGDLLIAVAADSAERGTLMQCLAWCALLDNDDGSAFEYASAALQIHTVRHNRVDRAKAEWAIGRVLSRRNDHEAARAKFESASSALAECSQLDVWVRVRLDHVHDLLTADPRADVRALCESIAAVSQMLDQRERLRRHHCTAEALAYLRRSAAEDVLTAESVAYVIGYLDRLTTAPPARFTAPPTPHVM